MKGGGANWLSPMECSTALTKDWSHHTPVYISCTVNSPRVHSHSKKHMKVLIFLGIVLLHLFNALVSLSISFLEGAVSQQQRTNCILPCRLNLLDKVIFLYVPWEVLVIDFTPAILCSGWAKYWSYTALTTEAEVGALIIIMYTVNNFTT